MWTRIGVRTAVETSPASVFFTASAREDFSVALTGWSTSTGEPDTHLTLMVATPDPPRGRNTRLRTDHYGNPEVDALIDRALTTIDLEQREKLYFQAIRIGFQRDLAVIPLHHKVHIWAMRKGIAYTPMLSEQTRATEFAPAK
jgi:peptide/nickel transport system substrate-binding protein